MSTNEDFIAADNVRIAKRLEAERDEKRKASLRRLKQRIANHALDTISFGRVAKLADINAAIDAWDAAERKRGAR